MNGCKRQFDIFVAVDHFVDISIYNGTLHCLAIDDDLRAYRAPHKKSTQILAHHSIWISWTFWVFFSSRVYWECDCVCWLVVFIKFQFTLSMLTSFSDDSIFTNTISRIATTISKKRNKNPNRLHHLYESICATKRLISEYMLSHIHIYAQTGHTHTHTNTRIETESASMRISSERDMILARQKNAIKGEQFTICRLRQPEKHVILMCRLKQISLQIALNILTDIQIRQKKKPVQLSNIYI